MHFKFLFNSKFYKSHFNFYRARVVSFCLPCLSIRHSSYFQSYWRNSKMHSQLKSQFTLDRGLLVLFEGVDRAGKTTQTELLFKWIQDNKVGKATSQHQTSVGQTDNCSNTTLLKFPERSTPVGKIIDSYLKKIVSIRLIF